MISKIFLFCYYKIKKIYIVLLAVFHGLPFSYSFCVKPKIKQANLIYKNIKFFDLAALQMKQAELLIEKARRGGELHFRGEHSLIISYAKKI